MSFLPCHDHFYLLIFYLVMTIFTLSFLPCHFYLVILPCHFTLSFLPCHDHFYLVILPCHFTLSFYLVILPCHFTLSFYLVILPCHFTLSFYLVILPCHFTLSFLPCHDLTYLVMTILMTLAYLVVHQPVLLNCSHTFCQYCIDRWKKNKKDCPTCRAPITSESRVLAIDNLLEKIASKLSEEIKKNRETLIKEREGESLSVILSVCCVLTFFLAY